MQINPNTERSALSSFFDQRFVRRRIRWGLGQSLFVLPIMGMSKLWLMSPPRKQTRTTQTQTNKKKKKSEANSGAVWMPSLVIICQVELE